MSEEIPVVPTDVQLSYLAEGAANIIYRLETTSHLPLPSPSLLRLRKTLPSSAPNAAAWSYLRTRAHPLFSPTLLIPTTIVALPPGLLSTQNTALHAHEAAGKRRKDRTGLYLDENERFAFQLADMSPQRASQVLVEFKPKWVVQSPSAPNGWTRCRTCALKAKKGKPRAWCPLDLASGQSARVIAAVDGLVTRRPPAGFNNWEHARPNLVRVVAGYLLTSPLLPTLKTLQSKLDSVGPADMVFAEHTEKEKEFLDCMTVRDLTVFLRVDMDAESVECGVADLDMKSPDNGKAQYWRELERGLVTDGWYTGDVEGESRCCV